MAKVFTPNVTLGNPDARYRLYRRGHNDTLDRGNVYVSISPRGEKFSVAVVGDTCGLPNCNCAAYAEPIDDNGRRLLVKAEQF